MKLLAAAFRYYTRTQVRQSIFHDRRITALYAAIREAAEQESYEDNKPTLNAFLRERFEASLAGPVKKSSDI
ncbi:MAG: hypothetical protein ACREEW_14405 [Caulobacteraceae bacterium]